MKNEEELAEEAYVSAMLLMKRIPLQSFEALKPPKRGGSRESIPNAANSLRRAFIDQVAASPESLRAAWRYGCWLFDNNCYICDKPFTPGDGPQADHVVPPGYGGSTNAGNMLPAHSSCNTLKGDELPETFFAADPDKLALIRHYQRRFGFVPDPTLYPLADERVSYYIETMRADIVHTRNQRGLSEEETAEEELELPKISLTPEVLNLTRAVDYYLELNSESVSAKKKMRQHTRRILASWYSTQEGDMFTASEETLEEFIRNYAIAHCTNHRDSFNRTHRAFSILGEVFQSVSLRNIYTRDVPVSLSELRETHEYVGSRWVSLEMLEWARELAQDW